MYATAFQLLARVGKPFGGIPPRRITHWLARKAYGKRKVFASDFRWHRDRYDNEFLVHPHFLIDYNIIAFGIYDPQTANYIDKHVRPGMVCLDVGANIGVVSLHLARRTGVTGVVHCFEPVPHVFRRLQQHVERNQFQSIVRLHAIALSDQTGTISMSITDEDSSNQGIGSVALQNDDALDGRIDVRTMTLDEFAETSRLERLDFAKIDIQGAEPLFLQGGERTLARFRPDLLMEVESTYLAALGKSSADLLRQVESMGYAVFALRDDGGIGDRLRPDEISPDFSSYAIVCRAAT